MRIWNLKRLLIVECMVAALSAGCRPRRLTSLSVDRGEFPAPFPATLATSAHSLYRLSRWHDQDRDRGTAQNIFRYAAHQNAG